MDGHGGGLTDLALLALIALLCGMVMSRMKQPAVIGYIVAGVVLGPSGLAVVSDRENINVLAELGVLLLLFTIGMELSLRAFRQIWKVALFCTLMQIGGSLAVMLAIAHWLEWSLAVGVLFGFILAMSSTAVAVKILEEIGELRTRVGQVTIGVLIAQDLAVVPMLLIVGDLAGGAISVFVPLKVILSIVVLIALIRFLSRRERVSLPFGKAMSDNPDLAPLMGLVYCFGAASLSGFIGLSPAYGAFLVGLIIGNSAERQPMIAVTHPIQSVLMMVFFLSIGLLLDLRYIWDNILDVLLLIIVVTLMKTAFNIGVLGLLGQPWPRAFIAGLTLAQIGEFSFLLAQTGTREALIADADYKLVIAVTVVSLMISPVWLNIMRRIEAMAMPGMASLSDLVRLLYGRDTAGLWSRSRWGWRAWQGRRRSTGLALRLGDSVMSEVLERAEKRKTDDPPAAPGEADADIGPPEEAKPTREE